MVYINGRYTGRTDRTRNETTVALPPVGSGDRLDIVVEGMGRINFGRAIKDFKGLTGDVTVTTGEGGKGMTWRPDGWTMRTLPDSYGNALRAFTRSKDSSHTAPLLHSRAGYYRGFFRLDKTGDTFVNMETWGKGLVYVNGHAIGRFWSIGPQQTLYVPGCWLKKGRNEIVVLDVTGPSKPETWGQDHPELDKLQLEKSNRHNNPGDRPDLNSATPAAKGRFAQSRAWQTIKFNAPARGRYLAIECSSTHDGSEMAAIAEIYVQDTDGRRIDRSSWSTKYADSEDADNGNHTGDKAFDLQESTWWSTAYGASMPHLLVIDMGAKQTIGALEYLPATSQDAAGLTKDYRIFVY